MADVKPNMRGIASLLTAEGTAALVSDTADRVAARAAAATGSVNDQPPPIVTRSEDMKAPNMRRLDEAGKTRARSVIIGQHPTPKGRKAEREALQTAAARKSSG